MSRILVEGLAPDAIALARLLAREGHSVSLLGDRTSSEHGLPVVAQVPTGVGVAYLDVWTAEVDDRVRRLRDGGARLSCLSDLVLERATIPTVGVTGTAGKSTTASFVAQLLRRLPDRGPVLASTTAPAANLWATEESLTVLEATRGIHVLELTSSHLVFMRTSPHVAVITSFWPDHLELHGSLSAYRAAKRQIVRCQAATDHLVVNADDPAAEAFAVGAPAAVHRFSARGAVERGVYVAAGRIRAAPSGLELGPAVPGTFGQALLAAAAAVLAAGGDPESLVGMLEGLDPPPGRARRLGKRGSTVLIDDTMAATPGKTRAALEAQAAGTVVLVAGGEVELGGRPVHASDEEQAGVAAAVAEIRRVAVALVCFGPAGAVLARAVGADVPTTVVATVEEAVVAALARSSNAAALIVSPMFPVSPAARARVAGLLRAAARE